MRACCVFPVEQSPCSSQPTFLQQPKFPNSVSKCKDPPRYEDAVKQTRSILTATQVNIPSRQHILKMGSRMKNRFHLGFVERQQFIPGQDVQQAQKHPIIYTETECGVRYECDSNHTAPHFPNSLD